MTLRCTESDLVVARAEQGPFPKSNMQQPALELELSDVRAALRELRFAKAEVEIGVAAALLLPTGATCEARVRAALKVLKLRSARATLPMAMATV